MKKPLVFLYHFSPARWPFCFFQAICEYSANPPTPCDGFATADELETYKTGQRIRCGLFGIPLLCNFISFFEVRNKCLSFVLENHITKGRLFRFTEKKILNVQNFTKYWNWGWLFLFHTSFKFLIAMAVWKVNTIKNSLNRFFWVILWRKKVNLKKNNI